MGRQQTEGTITFSAETDNGVLTGVGVSPKKTEREARAQKLLGKKGGTNANFIESNQRSGAGLRPNLQGRGKADGSKANDRERQPKKKAWIIGEGRKTPFAGEVRGHAVQRVRGGHCAQSKFKRGLSNRKSGKRLRFLVSRSDEPC